MLLVAATFFGLLALGMPVGFVLGIAGLVGIFDMGGGRFLAMAPDRMFAGLDLFPFLAMPFFILAGEIMNRSGITDRLILLADALVGWLRGGMAHSNMVASVFFAGITGAATADAAAFGNTLVPAMVKQGYTRPFACAVTAAGSIIGPTIPPSTLMVIYGGMGLLGVRLDIGTAMLASLILGAGVDYAVHLTSAWHVRAGEPLRDAAAWAANYAGPAIWTNAIMVCVGFFVLTLGEARPLQNVGSLTATAMIVAALATFICIPVLARKRFYRQQAYVPDEQGVERRAGESAPAND